MITAAIEKKFNTIGLLEDWSYYVASRKKGEKGTKEFDYKVEVKSKKNDRPVMTAQYNLNENGIDGFYRIQNSEVIEERDLNTIINALLKPNQPHKLRKTILITNNYDKQKNLEKYLKKAHYEMEKAGGKEALIGRLKKNSTKSEYCGQGYHNYYITKIVLIDGTVINDVNIPLSNERSWTSTYDLAKEELLMWNTHKEKDFMWVKELHISGGYWSFRSETGAQYLYPVRFIEDPQILEYNNVG